MGSGFLKVLGRRGPHLPKIAEQPELANSQRQPLSRGLRSFAQRSCI